MLDDDESSQPVETSAAAVPARRTRRRAASRPAGPPETAPAAEVVDTAIADEAAPATAPAKRTAAKRTTKKTAATAASATDATDAAAEPKKSAKKTTKKTTSKTAKGAKTAKKTSKSAEEPEVAAASTEAGGEAAPASATGVALLFQAPDLTAAQAARATAAAAKEAEAESSATADEPAADDREEGTAEEGSAGRRRRSRGGRNRRKSGTTDKDAAEAPTDDSTATPAVDPASDDEARDDESTTSHRRRRRRRSGEDSGDATDDPAKTVVRVRNPRSKTDAITSVEGSTRIEAKRQRRREGREAGRRRPPILSESEFLARRESVDRVMAIRQRGEVTQIAVLEDNILVEHYVALESQTSIIGNVYLGRVQNVLPSMEAAFIDIGKGRNAVLYAGEVDWDLMEGGNQSRRIENALKPGQTILVQVSKDPIGHKGARLTSQISLPGRYLVYVPGGGTSGISRKLPDTERTRLKNLLKDILPDEAGVIIRTAAEGASEDELQRDVARLTARWDDIDKKSQGGQAPALLYGEPDTTIKVVRDLFTEDFAKLVISGDDAWDMVDGYVKHVAPDLAERLERHTGDTDIFTNFRIDEQIAKALDRKVWLPSGGSLVIDRTEAMTVVDVNTGKFTGSGGNLEETVTKNNLEAAEEIVRQLRLRDVGGIIVIDFIDMVLENNRDLVLRRLVECLGRDRTRHQVAEVTSLGLVQMTRKRISTGLLEVFSHTCEVCQGRGVIIESEPIEPKKTDNGGHSNGRSEGSSRGGTSKRSSSRRRGRRGGGGDNADAGDSSDDGGASRDGADKPAEASVPVVAASNSATDAPVNGDASSSDSAGSSDNGEKPAKSRRSGSKSKKSAAKAKAPATADANAAAE